MRKTINISVSEDMHRFIVEQSKYGTVSEYIRSLVREAQHRRADNTTRPAFRIVPISDHFVIAEAIEQLER